MDKLWSCTKGDLIINVVADSILNAIRSIEDSYLYFKRIGINADEDEADITSVQEYQHKHLIMHSVSKNEYIMPETACITINKYSNLDALEIRDTVENWILAVESKNLPKVHQDRILTLGRRKV